MTGSEAHIACSDMLTAFTKIQAHTHMSSPAYTKAWRIAENMILKYGVTGLRFEKPLPVSDVKVHASDEDKKRGIMHVNVTPVKGPEVVVTAGAFKAATGHDPQHDDLDRCNCPNAGEVGHHACGWCEECNGPRFMCAHLLFKNRPKEGE